MQLAADHDGVAREYATAFATTFEVAVPALLRTRADGLSWDDGVVETFMTVLAAQPDTHIARRGGAELARDVSERAAEVMRAGGIRTDEGRRALGYFDHSLRDPRNTGNPGTTADVTAAALFVALLQGAWT
jgi:triphosphoribosyl-dephospho-CoA synthase